MGHCLEAAWLSPVPQTTSSGTGGVGGGRRAGVGDNSATSRLPKHKEPCSHRKNVPFSSSCLLVKSEECTRWGLSPCSENLPGAVGGFLPQKNAPHPQSSSDHLGQAGSLQGSRTAHLWAGASGLPCSLSLGRRERKQRIVGYWVSSTPKRSIQPFKLVQDGRDLPGLKSGNCLNSHILSLC